MQDAGYEWPNVYTNADACRCKANIQQIEKLSRHTSSNTPRPFKYSQLIDLLYPLRIDIIVFADKTHNSKSLNPQAERITVKALQERLTALFGS